MAISVGVPAGIAAGSSRMHHGCDCLKEKPRASVSSLSLKVSIDCLSSGRGTLAARPSGGRSSRLTNPDARPPMTAGRCASSTTPFATAPGRWPPTPPGQSSAVRPVRVTQPACGVSPLGHPLCALPPGDDGRLGLPAGRAHPHHLTITRKGQRTAQTVEDFSVPANPVEQRVGGWPMEPVVVSSGSVGRSSNTLCRRSGMSGCVATVSMAHRSLAWSCNGSQHRCGMRRLRRPRPGRLWFWPPRPGGCAGAVGER